MSADALVAAGMALAAAMTAETAALAEPGFPDAAARAAAKCAALDAFAAALVPPLPEDPRLAPLLAQLRGLADANRAALGDAIALQGAVMGVLRDAMLRADPEPGPRALSLEA